MYGYVRHGFWVDLRFSRLGIDNSNYEPRRNSDKSMAVDNNIVWSCAAKKKNKYLPIYLYVYMLVLLYTCVLCMRAFGTTNTKLYTRRSYIGVPERI